MKLEVGIYVRTKGGNIFKINYSKLEQTEENWLELYRYNDNYSFFNDKDIIKVSFNIIDLIEVGDYVNGKKVIDKQYRYTDKDNYDMGEWCIFYENEALGNYQKEIQSIVTKEQFSAMEYKVESEVK